MQKDENLCANQGNERKGLHYKRNNDYANRNAQRRWHFFKE
jgi:hypothetical protein